MNGFQVALVTGANRGIGLEVCRQLAEKNHQVILTCRDHVKGNEAIRSLNGLSPKVLFHPLDVTSPKSIAILEKFVSREIGRLDILINNAAINYDTWQSTLNADLIQVATTLETNLMGPWRMIQTFYPLMEKHHFGRIVNVSSGAGSFSSLTPGTPAYSISKAALNMLTLKAAGELKGFGILVNAVCPGWVRTEMGGPSAPKSPAQGAEGIVWAAQLPDGGPSGKFFRDQAEIKW
ncbi:SDR family oxidoreductase [Pararhodonellum marinum]|uniref:SDR family oxidoreductase n=1 Tax=Pararhodonellum marinum TaxID=2755358 RepID=UPI00188EA533|nr:SDR family oxidoreductase [Pararhodonellum marinum]